MRGLYRWHIPDPIYFDSDLRVTWQQIGTEEAGNFERQDDVASVAYWYQLEPHTPFDPIGDRHFRSAPLIYDYSADLRRYRRIVR